MKSLLASFLIVGFMGVAAFGVFGVHSGTQNHDGGCALAATKGIDCPNQNDPLGYLTFHLNAYKDLSLAAFGENDVNALLFTFALLLFISVVFSSTFLFRQFRFALYLYRFRESFYSPQKLKLIRWLSLHENSPAT